jgi:pantoate--beta-alanine ligase
MILRKISTAPAAKVDYVTIADAETLEPVREVRRNTVLALAVFFGRTRLIDNLWIKQ